MSNPGDKGREQIVVNVKDPAEIVVFTAKLVQERGGVSFEHGYTNPPGTDPWPDDYEAGPDDDTLWYAEAVIRRKIPGRRPFDTTYRGEALVKAGASHVKGGTYACIELIEKMGGNVVVLDLTDTPEERPPHDD